MKELMKEPIDFDCWYKDSFLPDLQKSLEFNLNNKLVDLLNDGKDTSEKYGVKNIPLPSDSDFFVRIETIKNDIKQSDYYKNSYRQAKFCYMNLIALPHVAAITPQNELDEFNLLNLEDRTSTLQSTLDTMAGFLSNKDDATRALFAEKIKVEFKKRRVTLQAMSISADDISTFEKQGDFRPDDLEALSKAYKALMPQPEFTS